MSCPPPLPHGHPTREHCESRDADAYPTIEPFTGLCLLHDGAFNLLAMSVHFIQKDQYNWMIFVGGEHRYCQGIGNNGSCDGRGRFTREKLGKMGDFRNCRELSLKVRDF